MGNTTQRRERRQAEDLRQLLDRNQDRFVQVWNRYLTGWGCEVMTRARALRTGSAPTQDVAVLPILNKAERLLTAIGGDAERLVGRATRQLLSHECCKAIAGATDPRLYLFAQDSVCRVIAAASKPTSGARA